MAYSITTQDGITVPNIPDDMPADHPMLKARVAELRAQRPAAEVQGDASKGGKLMGLGMGLTDMPVAAGQLLQNTPIVSDGLNLLRRGIRGGLSAVGANDAASLFGDVTPQQFNEMVGQRNKQYEADRAAAGREGFDWSRLGGNVANPINLMLPGAAQLKTATTVAQLAKAGAMAGASSGALQPVADAGDNYWGEKAMQTGAGAATGAALTPVVAKGLTAAATGAKRVIESAAPRVTVVGGGLTRQDMDAAVGQLLQSQGMRLDEAPKAILDSVRRQISEASFGGKQLNPAMAMRQAEAEAIGLTGEAAMTAGQASRDPLQWAHEKNLSGIMFDTPQGPQNPLATRFAAQNQRLQGVFNDLGAGRAVDRVADGDLALTTLQAANRTADDNVRAAYQAFEQATGRKLELPLQGLAQDYAEALRRYGDNIPQAVRSAFEGLGLMGGTQRRVMTLEGAEDLIKNVINRNDPGPINKPVHGALGELRASIEQAITSGADNAASGAGAQAAMLAKEARSTAAGVFRSRREIPALQAAADDLAPDSFFQRFLLNRSAPTREVEGMAGILRQNPEAWQQVRAQVAGYLKKAAFGNNLAGDKTVAAERFATALDSIGPQKLAVIFGPDEVVRLQIAARVAAQLESAPAGAKGAHNTSGTAAGVFNLLQGLGNSAALRSIPGVRSLANQAGQIVNERAATAALQGAPAAVKPPAQLSPEAMQAIRRLFLPTAVGGGAAASGAF